MDSTPETIPELDALLKKLDEAETLENVYGLDKQFLLDEVRFSNLRRMSDINLQGRFDYYLKDYTFELNPRRRREYQREVVRTKIEIRRRAIEARAHTLAKVLAEEAKPAPGTIELAAAA